MGIRAAPARLFCALVITAMHNAVAFTTPSLHCITAAWNPLSLKGKTSSSDRKTKVFSAYMAHHEEFLRGTMMSSRRQLLGYGTASILLLPTLSFAEKVEKVKPGSPGVALDMILTMKVARNLRNLEDKVQKGDFKAVDGFLSNSWNSGSAAFLRKTKVLESLSVGAKGTAAGGDLDSDPAFANEKSPESIKLEGMVETFYKAADQLAAAAKAKSKDDTVAAYAATVSALDAYLAAAGLPSVSDADPSRIVTP